MVSQSADAATKAVAAVGGAGTMRARTQLHPFSLTPTGKLYFQPMCVYVCERVCVIMCENVCVSV